MAHSDTEQEAPAGLFGERVRCLAHHARVAVEQVGDPGGEAQRGGVLGEHRDVRERVAADGFGQPQRGVPELLDALSEGACVGGAHRVGEVPHAHG